MSNRKNKKYLDTLNLDAQKEITKLQEKYDKLNEKYETDKFLINDFEITRR